MQKTLVIFFLLIVVINTNAEISPYYFQYINLHNGLSHADANCMVQDSKGFIWIGTYSGINRFDGYRVKSFYNNNDMSHASHTNRVLLMDIDENRKIWHITLGGLIVFDAVKEEFLQYHCTSIDEQYLITNAIKLDIKCQNGYLYILYGNNELHIYEIDDEKKTFSLIANSGVWKGNMGELAKSDNGYITTIIKNKLIAFANGKPQHAVKLPNHIDEIHSLYINCHTRKITICTLNSLYIYGIDGNKLTLQHAQAIAFKEDITDLVQDNNGICWISTYNGLYKITPLDASVEHILSTSGLFSISSDYINRLLLDKTGVLFIATYAGGVNYLNLYPSPISIIYETQDKQFKFNGFTIRSIIEQKGSLFVGLHTDGVVQMDKSSHKLLHHFTSDNILRDGNIRDMLAERHGLILVGHNKGIDVIDPITKQNVTPAVVYQEFKVPIQLLEYDIFGQIWVADELGLSCLKYENGSWIVVHMWQQYPQDTFYANGNVIMLYCDLNRPEIMVSTPTLLCRLILDKEGRVEKKMEYRHIEGEPKSLVGDFICSAYRENDSTLWVGHIGNALSRITFLPEGKYKAENFSTEDAEKFKDFEDLQPDSVGNIWIAGNSIAIFNIPTRQYRFFSIDENRNINSYKLGASYKSSNGKIYFGGSNGFSIITSRLIGQNPYSATPMITDLYINGNPLPKKQKIAAGNIKSSTELTLSYKENNLSFFFSSMHYASASSCQFKYRLIGADRLLQKSKNAQMPANYSGLNPGKYIFELYASNNDGVWNETPQRITITILPPWWLSTSMKVLYVVILLAIVYFVSRYFLNLYKLRHHLQLKEIEEKQKEKMHQMQLQLFTNISHEFRTPLTLILGTTEQIQIGITNGHIKKQLLYLKKNVNRLLTLVNELMDFRKAQSGSFQLLVRQMDVNSFIRSITDEFVIIAETNGINYVVNIAQTPLFIYADPKILEKIFINILNNAFKYCKSGTIEIELTNGRYQGTSNLCHSHHISSDYEAKEWITFRVKDTGIGVSRQSIEKVFDRYYQIEDSENDPHLGSGVGLSLVKSLLLLYKGKLTLYSERNKGTEFIVSLPCHRNDFADNQIKNTEKQPVISPVSTFHLEEQSPELTEEAPARTSGPKLLLVEDNTDVRTLLTEALGDQYIVQTACNGIEALECIALNKPDLIVSDLMMPRMDGNKLCSKLKEMSDTSDIPFILLTGKDTLQAQAESIKCGADLFLNKPVSMDLLKDSLKNLYTNKQHILKKISKNYIQHTLRQHQQVQDNELSEKVIEIIKANIDNVQLDATFICEQLGMSKSGLYQKTKHLFDKPIIELVRDIRLTKAVQIMSEENISMAEVAARTGFQNQSYFTSTFKKKYGMTPSQYLKQMRG